MFLSESKAEAQTANRSHSNRLDFVYQRQTTVSGCNPLHPLIDRDLRSARHKSTGAAWTTNFPEFI